MFQLKKTPLTVKPTVLEVWLVEENYIPLETQSKANTPVTPSEPKGSKGKGKRHSRGHITAKRWTPISTQRKRKPKNSESIWVKPTLTTCTGKITLINPVVTSKGKLSKAVDSKFVQGTVKKTLASKGTNQRKEKACPEPDGLEEDTLGTVVEGKKFIEIMTTLPFKFQFNRNLRQEDWKDMDEVLKLHKLLKELFQSSMDNKRFNLAPHWEEVGASWQKICLKELDFKALMVNTKGEDKDTRKKQDIFQPKVERVRPHDPEAVGFGERSTQEPEIVLHNSRISSPINRNITPTQIEHNVVTPESNLNSDVLWLQMSQFAEKTQKQFSELQASHERMKTSTPSMDKIVKTLQEGHAKLSKASEETNKRLNEVSQEQNHSQRNRDCLDQDINKQLSVYHDMNTQPQGHVMDNPYHQEDIKPDATLGNKTRSPSQYQDGDNMSYYEKEALKKLPEASSWTKFSGTGKYDHMELSDHIDGLFIDVPSIPHYWITARLNTAFKGHASIWYTKMKKIHGRRN
ncbi:hypothetical protein O181_016195 [Austropuccinia psidii MF-1]|uniref:Uncharacterized protein n=1 Tax=Austropuccinia psidii MF-1 TaxID=1389203 RepID=A0A9Q3C4E0_9BASI|nr:hypothetical protein [Austropuccinia psidii MF-1]